MKPKSDFHIAGQPMESHPEYPLFGKSIFSKNAFVTTFLHLRYVSTSDDEDSSVEGNVYEINTFISILLFCEFIKK